jgi:hypothetical protein
MVTHRTQLITIRYSQNIILTSPANNGWPEAHSRHKIQITPGSGQYVFVNLFGGRIGAAMTYPAVHQLIGRIAARTGISFTAHMLRHSHATAMEGRGIASDATFRAGREEAVAGAAALPGGRRAGGRAAGHAVDQGLRAAGCAG